ncbi:uncharacterized protein LOC132723544 [Ruditapes philippinarum]|uniref:uncharacterized protein LOC132723544 n=1 Tax=Ruditapes philippinarum TaxID=129788 RepID=UPI00295AD704|nr:uncharacterized protein LOC132723544 [Ruditapes philippinarum]
MMQQSSSMDRDDDVELLGRRRMYTLPTLRFLHVAIVILLIDGIVSVTLWLTGGDSDYFIDSIKNFKIKHSVFDLALLAFVKVIIHSLALSILESVTLKLIDFPLKGSLHTTSKLLHFLHIVLSFGSLVYTAVKGGFVLNEILHEETYERMHSTYNVLLICAVAFSLIEFGAFLYGVKAMKNLESIRICHIYDENGIEIDKEGNPVKKKVNIRRVFALAKPELHLLSVASLCLLVSSGSQMVAPLYFGKVVDAAQKSMDELNKTVLTLLIIYIGGGVFGMGRSWLYTLSGHRVVARLRKNLFRSIIKQDIAFFDTNRTGELCNRLSSDTQVLQNAVTVNISMLVRNLLQIIGSLVLMFSLNPSLTGVLLSVVPIIAIGAVQYGMFMKNQYVKFQARLGDAGSQAEESLSSIRTVRTFSAEKKSCDLYGKDIDKSYAIGAKLAALGGMFEGGIGIVVYGAITLVLWYGGKLVHENAKDSTKGISPGIFTSFLLYTLQVAISFATMSSLYGDFMKAVGASVRVFDLMDNKPKVSTEDGGKQVPDLDGRIEFKSVEFTYPSRPETKVVKGLSLKVEPGQMVALVGPSGGGKSTLVTLIERFYDPDAGYISIGGIDLRELDQEWLRQKISMVSQEPTLFACSIKENIAYGREASMEEVIAVAKEANAHEFITTFEEGYDTLVGERGVRLSGGQKQRVAIARALIMNPKILLLDEATSALDAESEHLVQEAIDRAMKGRTVVIIAHRLSTVRNASKVVVIDKGEIAEQGTHEELLDRNGVYKRLVLRQLTAGAVTDPASDKLINEDADDKDLLLN